MNGFHSGGSPLQHVEHNNLVRKSSTEPQVKVPDGFFLSFLLERIGWSWAASYQKRDGQIIVDLSNIFLKLYTDPFFSLCCDFTNLKKR